MKVFFERQRLPSWLLYGTAIFFVGFIVLMLTEGIPQEGRALMIIPPLAVALLFVVATLETVVYDDSITVRFIPFQWKMKRFPISQITEVFIRQYDPIGDYGGWGIRRGWGKNDFVYNARGKVGIQIVLRDGKRYLIGTQRPQELLAAIEAQTQSSK